MQKCVNKFVYIYIYNTLGRQKCNKIKLNLITQSNPSYSLRFSFFHRPFDLEHITANEIHSIKLCP